MKTYHTPVLADVIGHLVEGRSRAVDCTVGGGGHTAVLRHTVAAVLAIDQDPEAMAEARRRLHDDRITWLQANFASEEARQAIAQFHADFILFDLGVSGQQLDAGARGFSFRPGVRLDMRMSGTGQTAAEVLAGASREELAEMFRSGADEPRAARLASIIVRRRQREAFEVSEHLVNAIREALGARSGPSDFARLFQAVRMAVNRELEVLAAALPAALDALAPGGMIAVISYHSGEDRIVKHLFRDWARHCVCEPEQPICSCRGCALGTVKPAKPIWPGPAEIERNPRARSARLRGFMKASEGAV